MNTTTKKIFLSVVGVIVVGVIGFMIMFNINTQSISENSETVLFDVREGENLNAAIERLEEENIIKSSFFTKLKAKLGKHSDVYSGQYTLQRNWDSEKILITLGDEKNAADVSGTVMVTIIEGAWAKEVAREIAAVTHTKEERFLKLWNDEAYVRSLMEKYEVIDKALFDNKDSKVLLEGYLYPDTYEFNQLSTEEEITEKLLVNANDKFQIYKNQLNNFKLTPYEVTTLASIVEYEAPGYEEMQRVAGVFMNRIDQNMRLESSATVCYALYTFESWKECESVDGNKLESPYNTYRNEGLTPGPILNPSLEAIQAVLNYDKNDYLFFVADVTSEHGGKGDGTVYYSKTYEEHAEKVKELLGY